LKQGRWRRGNLPRKNQVGLTPSLPEAFLWGRARTNRSRVYQRQGTKTIDHGTSGRLQCRNIAKKNERQRGVLQYESVHSVEKKEKNKEKTKRMGDRKRESKKDWATSTKVGWIGRILGSEGVRSQMGVRRYFAGTPPRSKRGTKKI